MPDQATSLRLIATKRDGARRGERKPFSPDDPAIAPALPRPHILAVTSGKGGVGKTSVVANLAIMLSDLGRRVVILDADFGLANIDVMLGLAPKYHLGHLLNGSKSLPEIMIDGPQGIRIIPASSGIQKLSELTVAQCDHLVDSLKLLRKKTDYLLVDTAAGISDNVVNLLNVATEIVVVCEPEPTAVVDAYALIKVAHANDHQKPIRILVNSVESGEEAMRVYSQLDRVATRFIKRRVAMLGYIYKDSSLPMAVRNQTAVVSSFPNAPASRCFRTLAMQIMANETRAYEAPDVYAGVFN